MADTLPCPDGAGSINNPDNPGTTTPPYTVVEPCVGTWEISGADDTCAINETQNQAGYAAEIININGAPLNIFKLLGVHEQGDGSILPQGMLFASAAAPGYPLSNINVTGQYWQSFQSGNAVAGNAFVGVDFGINTLPNGQTEYLPIKPNWKTIGAILITQGDTAVNFARQVRVEITDGSIEIGTAAITGTGNGIVGVTAGPRAEAGTLTLSFTSPTSYSVSYTHLNSTISLGTGTVGLVFQHPVASITVAFGLVAWTAGDVATVRMNYVWKRAGVYNLTQSSTPIALNLQSGVLAKAVRVIPTLYTGSGNWQISALDVLDSSPTNINNIQDLFFNENRDRDYSKVPLQIKAQYQINNSIADLSKYGLNILDQYSFVVSFPVMVALLGRPLVTGDIIEVIPEMQYDQNLKAVRKFLEVTDTGWASEGFSTAWKPTLYRFAAQQALPSQETRDIFGTIDTQKHLVADSFFNELGMGAQIDTTPLTTTEEIEKTAKKAVPELGDDFMLSTDGRPMPPTQPAVNPKGQPEAIPAGNGKQGIYIEDGMPPNGEAYGEGYSLPDATTSADGAWFRLYYADHLKLAPRLYRFSLVKNKWIFMETDRRMEASSFKPSAQKLISSSTRLGLGKKQI